MKILRNYQKAAIETTVTELFYRHGFGQIMGMGLGKTAVSIKVLDILRLNEGPIKILVTCPSKVIGHWAEENISWGGINPAYVMDVNRAKRLEILRANHPGIYCISHKLLPWLESTQFQFDVMVIDEGSKFRNWSAKQTKAARRLVSRIKYRTLLTGTATPNNPGEIFSQQFMLDRGATLGSTIGGFRERFCYRGGFENRDWVFDQQYADHLAQLVSPWYLRQDTLDHLSMPLLIDRDVYVDLPPAVHKLYKRFERELFAELDSGEELLALSGSGKYNLCRQIASGGAYLEDGSNVGIHNAKIEALRDLVAETNRPILVAYHYKHEEQRLRAAFPNATFIVSGSSNTVLDTIKLSWKQGNIGMLVAQADSISHGVDGLQHGGADIVWFTLTDHPETESQFISRIWRQGQVQGVVTNTYLLATKTIDVAIRKLLVAKASTQADFLRAIGEYRISAGQHTNSYSWVA